MIRREVIAAYRERERRRIEAAARVQRFERFAKWAYIIGAPLLVILFFIIGTNP